MGCLNDIWNLFFYTNQFNKVTNDKDHKKNMLKLEVTMNFLMNDPTTPDLVLQTDIPRKPKICPPFNVVGFKGGQTTMWTDQWRAAQVHCTVIDALTIMYIALNDNASNKPISSWPATDNLIIRPNAGKDFNAYYDRKGLHFFSSVDPKTNKMIHTCESVDIVAHELGHAVLDSIRPDLWNLQSLETWSFHEGWADLVAIFTVMRHDEVLKQVLKDTNGDISKPNIINKIAEEMGDAIYNVTRGRGGRQMGSLRTAYNNFNYIDPSKLPRQAPDNALAKEPHSFGRVFLGAFWEIMVNIYNKERELGHSDFDAIRRMRNISSKLLARATRIAPATPRFFNSIGQTLVKLDASLGGVYHNEIQSVLQRRQIIGSEHNVQAMGVKRIKLKDVNLEKSVVDEHNGGVIVRALDTKTIRLNDHFSISAQSDNPLYNCQLEIPFESCMEFDKKGNLVDIIKTPELLAINAARDCVNFIQKEKLLTDNVEKQFSIQNNKLIRNFFN